MATEISFEPVVRHRWLVVIAYAAILVLAAPGVLRLHMDNSPEGFFVDDASAMERFQRLERDFGRDRPARLVVEGPTLWTREGLAWLARLEGEAQRPGGVLGAFGPYLHHRWHLSEWPPAAPGEFRKMVARDAVDRGAGLVGTTTDTLGVVAALYKLSPTRRDATLAALENLLADAPGDVTGEVTGLAVVNRALDQAQRRMARRFFPILVLVAVALLVVLFRSVSGVLLPLALVGVSQTVLFGAMGYAGERLDVVTILLAPLVFVIALATGVHVLAFHRRVLERNLSSPAATVETLRVKAWPVLWTGMTTCAAFGSLSLSSVPPVRALGQWTAFGIAFLTLAALSLFPALLAIAGGTARSDGGPARRGSFARWSAARGRAWAGWAVAKRPVVVAAFGLVALVAAAGTFRLAVETSVLTYFRPHHPLREAVERLQGSGLGSVGASLVIESPESLDDPAAFERLSALSAELRREPLVLSALSAGDVVHNVASYLDSTEGEARSLLNARRKVAEVGELGRLLALLLTDRGEHTRVVLTTAMRGYTDLEPLYRRAEAMARDAFPGAEVWVTGEYPLVLAAQRTLLWTMVASLSVTLLVIAVMLRLLLRSTSLTWRALVPNIWPVLIVLGTMGWTGVPVDSATVMIAAVVLGLAVDDTLHTLGHLRRVAGRPPRRDLSDQVVTTMAETTGGHLATSLILSLGFAVCGLSSLVPVSRFGALSSLAIAAALLADLTLVPALLVGVPSRAMQRFAVAGGRSPETRAG